MNLPLQEAIHFDVASAVNADPAFVHESPDEQVTLALPLYSGWTSVETGGSSLYEGRVAPGMMRVGLPGDRVTIRRPVGSRALFVGVPTAWYRRLAKEVGAVTSDGDRLPSRPILRPNP